MRINNLLQESVTTADNAQGRPALVGLTRAVNNLVFSDIVAVQPTSQPTSTLFGIKYMTPHGDQIFETSATYGGAANQAMRASIAIANLQTNYKAGDVFKSNADVVYEVVKPGTLPLASEGNLQKSINRAVVTGQVRFKAEAAPAEQYQRQDEVISECNFSIDRWTAPVRTRKLKTDVTVELMQDMEANQLDAENLVDDVLATFISDEINKEITQTMIAVSHRYKTTQSQEGILDLSAQMDAPGQARTIYQYICDMAGQMQRTTSFNATWVLCSARVAGLLASSGWMVYNENPLSEGVLKNGLEVYSDATTSFDYMIVGCKHSISDLEHVGSLFYSPFTEADEAGAIRVVVDPDSLQPKLMIMARYSLSVNPFTTHLNEDKRNVQGDDWSKLVGCSKMSYMMGIDLPVEV